ncbi:hypothetical protein PIB30_046980 [Stylosanthes scabra]|uniref:Uncharacterized protein n=1 Tax=Stylosanthes scabra TaxID=79078 RepID=A0ABU6UFY3_9FABA|nr:hypothetical protein [Stylosanthes scabra]
MRPIVPFSPRPAASPSSSTSSGSTGSVHRERERSPRTLLPPMATALAPGPVHPIPRTPMCDARHYRSLFPRRSGTTYSSPPSPPPSDDEPSVETYDRQLNASYGSKCESASTDTAPSSHHSSGSSSGYVSLGYGSASSGSASDGASDDDLVNQYFAGTFPPP